MHCPWGHVARSAANGKTVGTAGSLPRAGVIESHERFSRRNDFARSIILMTTKTKQLFGTDGVRGLPGEFPLDDSTLDRIGMALCEYVSSHAGRRDERPRVLIGRDTRESGPH